jgi:integrase
MIDLYKQYVQNETQSESTIRIRAHYIDRLAADLDVTTATEPQLETWLRSHGWSPTSINCALSSIRHFYRWAERYGHIPDNPTKWLRRVRVPRKVGRIADDAAIREACMRAPVATRIMLLLGAECGLRRSEIAAVHRDDFDGDWLYVVGKGGHQRTVNVSADLRELLDIHPEEGWLFPKPDGSTHITGGAVYRRIQRVAQMNPHSLRHRAGTAVYRGTGNNLRVAQEFLGHASPEMTARYVHVTRTDLALASKAARLAA